MAVRQQALDGRRLWPDRDRYLGGSDLGDLASRRWLSLWAKKSRKLLSSSGLTPVLKRGIWYESAVIYAVRDEHPEWTITYPVDFCLIDDDHRLICHPDAIASIPDEPGLTYLELKTAAPSVFEDFVDNGLSLGYRLQALHGARMLGAERGKVAVLKVDAYHPELRIFDVPRHPGSEAKINELAAAFWEMVDSGRRPAADADGDGEILAELYPESVPEPVLDLTGDNRLSDLLPKLIEHKAAMKITKAAIDDIETVIKDKLGPAERGKMGEWILSWKTTHRKEFVQAATTYRKLSVKAPKEAAQ
jgi:hypothetical protein